MGRLRKIIEKYNILPWKNTSYELYGVYDADDEVFSAFYHVDKNSIDYAHYSIKKVGNKYFFTLQFDSNKKVENEEPKQMTMRMIHGEEFYNMFIEKIKNDIKKLKNKKSNDECTKKDVWMISLKNNKMKYKGEEMLDDEHDIFKTINDFFNFYYFYCNTERILCKSWKEDKKVYNYISEDKDCVFASEFVRYCKEKKINDEDAMIIYFKLRKYEDVLEEFFNYLRTKKYDMINAIDVEGRTAKEISESNLQLEPHEVYLLLVESIEKEINDFKPEKYDIQFLYGPPPFKSKSFTSTEEIESLDELVCENPLQEEKEDNKN